MGPVLLNVILLFRGRLITRAVRYWVRDLFIGIQLLVLDDRVSGAVFSDARSKGGGENDIDKEEATRGENGATESESSKECTRAPR